MSPVEVQGHGPRVSVVIPNFNGIAHLPECLECLFAQVFDDFEIVMVDNASTDDSVPWVRERYPAVRIVRREVNGGPTVSTNDGIRASRGEYVVILDNDTAFDPDWLGTLVKALDDHPEYDFGVSRVLHYEKDNLLQSAGAIYRVSWLSHFDRGSGHPSTDHSRMQRVVAATGNGAIHRRELFDEVGLYDEDYYAMYEDIDFSLRCLLKDKRCLYVPEACIRHKEGLCKQIHVSHEAQTAFARNGAIMAASVLPLPLLAIGIVAAGWREFRAALPVRPRYYRSIPDRVRRSCGRSRARWEGLRLGWAKRQAVWGSRTNSRAEIYRWLLRGEGPV